MWNVIRKSKLGDKILNPKPLCWDDALALFQEKSKKHPKQTFKIRQA